MSESPNFNLNCPDGGRGYVAYHFGTALKRYDYTQYINEDLAGDFACTLAQHLENTKAREAELQQRLTAADERADLLVEALRTSLLAMKRIYQAGYDRIVDAGGTCDTPEYMMQHDPTARDLRALLDTPAALGEIDLTPKRLAHAEGVIEKQNNLIASLRAELVESYRVSAQAQASR